MVAYRPKEIRRLYLNANTITVLLMQFPLFPLAKKVIDTIYPIFIANVACSMRLSYSWSLYLLIFCSVTVIYFAVNAITVYPAFVITALISCSVVSRFVLRVTSFFPKSTTAQQPSREFIAFSTLLAHPQSNRCQRGQEWH